MRPRFKRLQGMRTTITRSYEKNICHNGETKKGDRIWREVQKQVKQKVEDFKIMLETC